jgi:hypothetical protein
VLTAADIELLRVRRAISEEFPDFRVVRKTSSGFMQFLNVVLHILTLGYMRKFMAYTTTVGNTIYVAENWSEKPAYDQAVLLRHEAVHMRQRKRLGQLRFSLTYLFWPFPLVFASGRRDLEMEAYEESLKAYFEYYGEFVAIDTGIQKRVTGEFMGASYLWMWPWRQDIESWYSDVIYRLLSENHDGQNQAR